MFKSATIFYVSSVLFRFALAIAALPLLVFLITGENLGLSDWFIVMFAPVTFATLAAYPKAKDNETKRQLRIANIILVAICNIFIVCLLSITVWFYGSNDTPDWIVVLGLVLIIGFALLWSFIKEVKCSGKN
ncbi:hypothetical protein HYN59_05935 [Flavobacterium album]|uniref:Uncharacterized protein n=1 Tax=Flavobacterium album TaxID=2175091 RepID=A0A2S1QW89_9FLAO|nr:hypothetical protein HYN59_05935 [Flavobacterium album]